MRLADNPALHSAAKDHDVLPVYIWDDDDSKPWAPGAASKWWLHQSLTSLSKSLKEHGSRLILKKGQASRVLLDLVKETGAKAVYWNRRYEPALVAEDRETKQALRDEDVQVESFPGNLLFEPWVVQNKSGRPFQVFTPFWNTLRQMAPAEPVQAPKLSAAPKWPKSLDLAQLQLEPSIDWAGGIREFWKPGEGEALLQLRRFLKHEAGYSNDRDIPELDGTSRMSPYLTFGEISPRQVWYLAHTEAYRRQIAWREFSQHLLFHFPKTSGEPLRPEFARFPWKMDPKKFRAWRKGMTGYPIVDAGMRQLWHTGWMHNRVRMIAGSFLVKDLLIAWQEGAHWFWDTLVDADLGNNTMGWQWVGGCGADAAPYFRIFNPVLQGEKFDPKGAYVRKWVPELAAMPDKWIHRPWEAPPDVRGTVEYPAPIVDHAQARDEALAALATLKVKK